MGSEWRSGWYRGQRIVYQEAGGLKLLEGDIQLQQVDDQPPESGKRDGERRTIYLLDTARRWPGGVVPYEIEPGFPRPNEISEAIRIWEAQTSIRFMPRTTEPNWVRFQRNPGCNSALGMVGGEQFINLGPAGCGIPGTAHEIGHALGVHHEQQRPDRDRYIYPNLDTLVQQFYPSTFMPLFDFIVEGPYDYNSVMHYGRVISANPLGKLLLESIPAGIPIGGLVNDRLPYLSPSLANTVKRMYGAPVTDTTIDTAPLGRQILVDGIVLTAPRAFNWAVGSTHTIEYPDHQVSGPERYRFAGWSDGGERAHTITVTTAGQVYTAHATRELRLDGAVSAGGRVVLSPEPADGYYLQGLPVEAAARPEPGFVFESFSDSTDEWRIGLGLSTHPVTYLAWTAGRPRAIFRPQSRRPTTVAANWPYVTIELDGVPHLTPIAPAWFQPGSSHTLFAQDVYHWENTTRYLFVGWSDGAPAKRTIIADGRTYAANFRRQFKVTLVRSFGGMVEFAGPGGDGFYDEGAAANVSARPEAGFIFAGWAQGAAGSSPVARITVDRPVAVEAIFARPGQALLLEPRALLFRTTEGASPAPRSHAVETSGNLVVPFRVNTLDSWVQVTPSSATAPATLTVSVNAAGFRPGRYRTPVRLEPVLGGATRVLYVELWVEPAACRYTVTPPASPIPAAGGMGMVQLSVPDHNCNWTASSDSAEIRPVYAQGSGSITLPVSFPPNAGARRTVALTAAGVRVALTQTGKAALLRAVSGSGQTSLVGESLAAPLVAELVDSAGLPVPGALIEISAVGATSPSTAWTGADGRISLPVQFGGTPGPAKVTMRSSGVADLDWTFTVVFGPPAIGAAGVVNSASFRPGPAAPDQFVTLLGLRFAQASAFAPELPVELGGIRAWLTDRAGQRFALRLHAVTPVQINFLMPSEAAPGPATVRLERMDGQFTEAQLAVEQLSPGLFTANGNGIGVAAGSALVVDAETGARSNLGLFARPSGDVPWRPAAIDWQRDGQLYLVLYGTGFRHRSDGAEVKVEVGGVEAAVLFAGAHGEYAGLDQLNVRVPAELRREGLMDLVLSVDGRKSNPVQILLAPPGLRHRYRFNGDASDSIAGTRLALSAGAAVAGGALLLDGATGHATLPEGMLSDVASCTIEAWVTWEHDSIWSRIFDFGSGPATNLFLTPSNGVNRAPRFAITVSGAGGEQQINGSAPFPRGVSVHVAVTIDVGARTGTLYVGGRPVAVNREMTLAPRALGRTAQNWLGRSQYTADPSFQGRIDEFRIYDRALTAEEILASQASGPDRLP
ncbi:MAG: M12 family metallopeptidase [Bryobacteraceae bacterium]|nr:M12 family metallopeptidase [Bryobacteraceae bacterium]